MKLRSLRLSLWCKHCKHLIKNPAKWADASNVWFMVLWYGCENWSQVNRDFHTLHLPMTRKVGPPNSFRTMIFTTRSLLLLPCIFRAKQQQNRFYGTNNQGTQQYHTQFSEIHRHSFFLQCQYILGFFTMTFKEQPWHLHAVQLYQGHHIVSVISSRESSIGTEALTPLEWCLQTATTYKSISFMSRPQESVI